MTPARYDRGLATEIGFEVDGDAAVRVDATPARAMPETASPGSVSVGVRRNVTYAFGEIARIRSALELQRSARRR